jgi:hypothetical protein
MVHTLKSGLPTRHSLQGNDQVLKGQGHASMGCISFIEGTIVRNGYHVYFLHE